VLVGEIQADGQFETVWQTEGLVPGDAWSDYLPESKPLKGDWVELNCGNYNTETNKCLGATMSN
jgi:urea transport system substrate-binding protein